MDTRDDLFARILDAAARKKIRDEVELRRKTCDLRKLVAKRTEVDGGNFETIVVNCKKICHLNIQLKWKQN